MPSGTSTFWSRSIDDVVERLAQLRTAPPAARRARARTRRAPPRRPRRAGSSIQVSLSDSLLVYCFHWFALPLSRARQRAARAAAGSRAGSSGVRAARAATRARHRPADQRARRSSSNFAGCAVALHDPRPRRFARRRQVIVDPECRRRVRAPNLAVTLIVLRNLAADRLVVNGVRLDGLAQLGKIRQQAPQPLHVARVADVHRGRERRLLGARLPLAGRRESRESCGSRSRRARCRAIGRPSARAQTHAMPLPRLPVGTIEPAVVP